MVRLEVSDAGGDVRADADAALHPALHPALNDLVQPAAPVRMMALRDQWLLPVLRELVPPRTSLPDALEMKHAPGRPDDSYWRRAVAAGMTTDSAILIALARRSGLSVADPLVSSVEARRCVPERLARRYGVLPLTASATLLEVATSNPYDLDCEQTLAFVAGRRIRMTLASPTRIAALLEETYRPASVVERLLGTTSSSARVEEVTLEEYARDERAMADGARDRPIIRLVDHIVGEGVTLGASDVHLEPEEDSVAVRYRVDGVLRQALGLPRAVGLPLVSRVKIMARLDIADRLRPQGGRAAVRVNGERVDLRVSTLPAANGEKVVIRILDAHGEVRSLDALGLDDRDAAELQRLLDTREGLLLVTGPTGSGKTTTLYAALKRLLDRGLNVITVEDPVEYRIPGIVQVQVNDRAGLTFAAALRSILRQDPDVILVGEIRDQETAAIAIQAALTGHLVFATLHTMDAASSIARLSDLGVEPVKAATALKGVIAQRLLRRTCASCRTQVDEALPAALWGAVPSGARLLRGRGCRACGETGYKGRMAVVELLTVTPAVTRLVASAADAEAIREAARAGGARSLWMGGVARLLAGETAAGEVARVLEPDAVAPAAGAAGNSNAHGDLFGDDAYWVNEYLDGAERALQREPSRSSLHTPDQAEPHPKSPHHLQMTDIKVGVVDVYVIDPETTPWRALALRRAMHTRCPGSWEAVHGHIEDGETPEDAAVREVREETGLTIARLYNVTVHAFYLNRRATVELAVVFCAFVDSSDAVTLGREHQEYEWLTLDEAANRYIWPRATQALGEIRKLLGSGNAGPAEDVLRVR